MTSRSTLGNMVVCKKWTLTKAFSGPPDASNFKLETEELPEQLKGGGTLLLPFFLLSRWLCNLDYEVREHNWVIDWILSFTLAFKRWKIRNDVVYDIVNINYVSCQVPFILKFSLFKGVKHNVVLLCLSVCPLPVSPSISLSLHPSIFLSVYFFLSIFRSFCSFFFI